MTKATERFDQALKWMRKVQSRQKQELEDANAELNAAKSELLAEISETGLGLTKRQLEVIQLVRDKLQNKEIGARLGICERTIKYHISKLLRKRGVTSRHEL